MLEALRKTNGNVQTLSFPNSGHGTFSFVDRITELNEVGAFFDKHLARESPPATTAAAQADPVAMGSGL